MDTIDCMEDIHGQDGNWFNGHDGLYVEINGHDELDVEGSWVDIYGHEH